MGSRPFIWRSLFLTVFPNTIVLHLLGSNMLMPFEHCDPFNKIHRMWYKWVRSHCSSVWSCLSLVVLHCKHSMSPPSGSESNYTVSTTHAWCMKMNLPQNAVKVSLMELITSVWHVSKVASYENSKNTNGFQPSWVKFVHFCLVWLAWFGFLFPPMTPASLRTFSNILFTGWKQSLWLTPLARVIWCNYTRVKPLKTQFVLWLEQWWLECVHLSIVIRRAAIFKKQILLSCKCPTWNISFCSTKLTCIVFI